VANAEKTYADPSALLKLYLNEPESRAMTGWRAKAGGPLAVTHHGRVDDDFQQGRYVQVDLLWRAALKRAEDLSRNYSRTLGTRSLDVLHVASALELGFRNFLTFDLRQQNLARAVGLKPFVPSSQ
jgi:predicted nucleic acid-binding protein